MVQVNVHDAKTQLSRLIERALAGEEVIIARAGEPAVRLTPVSGPAPRVWGQDRGLIELSPDFDAPLSETEVEGFTDPAIFPGSR